MSRISRSQILVLQYIQFLLPLLLLSLGFWAICRIITLQTLNQSNLIRRSLIANTEKVESSAVQVISIDVTIIRPRNTSLAYIKLSNSTLREIEFELASTKPAEIEAIIAQELELPSQTVKALVNYSD